MATGTQTAVATFPVGHPSARRALWRQAFLRRSVWLRALKLGLAAGLLQAAINQGDHWLRGQLDGAVLLKSALSTLISVSLVLFSSAQTWVHRSLEQEPK